MIQQEALQKTNVADKSFFKRISPQRESRKNPQSQRLCGFMEGVDTLDATIKIQTQEEGFSKSSLNLM